MNIISPSIDHNNQKLQNLLSSVSQCHPMSSPSSEIFLSPCSTASSGGHTTASSSSTPSTVSPPPKQLKQFYGQGKGGKAKTQHELKRHRRRIRDNIQGISKSAIRRLARKGKDRDAHYFNLHMDKMVTGMGTISTFTWMIWLCTVDCIVIILESKFLLTRYLFSLLLFFHFFLSLFPSVFSHLFRHVSFSFTVRHRWCQAHVRPHLRGGERRSHALCGKGGEGSNNLRRTL